jgi:cytochrome c
MIKRTFLATVLLTAAPLSMAADLKNGETLHAENCIRCHDTGVYTRSNRRIQNLARLGSQVRFCKDNLSLTWFDDEVDDVIHHLNFHYYKF